MDEGVVGGEAAAGWGCVESARRWRRRARRCCWRVAAEARMPRLARALRRSIVGPAGWCGCVRVGVRRKIERYVGRANVCMCAALLCGLALERVGPYARQRPCEPCNDKGRHSLRCALASRCVKAGCCERALAARETADRRIIADHRKASSSHPPTTTTHPPHRPASPPPPTCTLPSATGPSSLPACSA